MVEVKFQGIGPEGSGRIVGYVLAGHRFEVELPIKKTMRETLEAIEGTMDSFTAQGLGCQTPVESRPIYIPDLSGDGVGGHLVVEATRSGAFAQGATGVRMAPRLSLRWESSRPYGQEAMSWKVELPFHKWDQILEDAKRQLRKATGDAW